MIDLIIQYAFYATLFFVFTWFWYRACAKLLRVYSKERMPLWGKILIYAFIVFADVPCNLFVVTFIGMEVPRVWKGEWTVTARMKRWRTLPAAYRRNRFATWLCDKHLDPYDPSGDHC